MVNTSINKDGLIIEAQDLSLLTPGSENDGRLYNHDGSSSITLTTGDTTTDTGFYMWDASASSWNPLKNTFHAAENIETNGSAATVRDTTNNLDIARLLEGGDSEFPNGQIVLGEDATNNSHNLRFSQTDYANGSIDYLGGGIRIWGADGSGGLNRHITSDVGGNVNIESGDLSIATGNEITDGSGNTRVKLNGGNTHLNDDAGRLGFWSGNGGGNDIQAYSDQPARIYDQQSNNHSVKYLTSSGTGTLQTTNANIDLNGNVLKDVGNNTGNNFARVVPPIPSAPTSGINANESPILNIQGTQTDSSGTKAWIPANIKVVPDTNALNDGKLAFDVEGTRGLNLHHNGDADIPVGQLSEQGNRVATRTWTNTHISDTANPHSVTASQTGATQSVVKVSHSVSQDINLGTEGVVDFDTTLFNYGSDIVHDTTNSAIDIQTDGLYRFNVHLAGHRGDTNNARTSPHGRLRKNGGTNGTEVALFNNAYIRNAEAHDWSTLQCTVTLELVAGDTIHVTSSNDTSNTYSMDVPGNTSRCWWEVEKLVV